MRSILIGVGVVGAVGLVIALLFWMGGDGSAPSSSLRPVPISVGQMRHSREIPDGGARWRPHPDRAGLRYSPKQ